MNNTSARWAKNINISKQEFDEYLVRLGLQKKTCYTNRWKATKEGKKYSRTIFGSIYWNVDAFFKVIKLRGKATHEYFFCDECNTYHKIAIEEKEQKSHICTACGSGTVML